MFDCLFQFSLDEATRHTKRVGNALDWHLLEARCKQDRASAVRQLAYRTTKFRKVEAALDNFLRSGSFVCKIDRRFNL
jgi:hypothetical protein